MGYVYTLNYCFGIHYDLQLEDQLSAALESIKYGRVANRGSMRLGGGRHLYMSSNSECPAIESRGFITINALDCEFRTFSSATDIYAPFDQALFNRIEQRHSADVHLITDIYDDLVRYFKVQDIDYAGLYLGWCSLVRVWRDDSAETKN